MRKLAEATAVPFPDSSADTAAAAPIPGLSVGNKPAPGQRGPKGLAPRTNYSRVNTGSPPPVDAGASSQKGAPPDTQNFLPSKIAHREVPMSGPMTPRTTLQELIKAAAVGASEHVSVSMEAARQLANSGEAAPVKTASAVGDDADSVPTAYVNKLAGACEYWLEELRKEAEIGPGTGPNALGVLEATSENNEFKSGDQGQATPAHVVPMTPGTHKPAETPAGPANALDTNAAHPVGGTQKTSGVTVDELRKAASPMGGLMGAEKTVASEIKRHGGDLASKLKGTATEAGGYLRGLAKDMPGSGVISGRNVEKLKKQIRAVSSDRAPVEQKLLKSDLLRERLKHHGTMAAGTAGLAGLGAGGVALAGHKKEAGLASTAYEQSIGGTKAQRALKAVREFAKNVRGKDAAEEVKRLAERAKPFGASAAMAPLVAAAKAPVRKARAQLAGGVLAAGGAAGGTVAVAKHHKKKESSALDPRLVDYFLSMTKSAEDAINPAQISAGPAVPPETSASGEAGGAPAGGQPQGPTGLIGSNEAAINYTKGQAKAPMKSQLSAVVTEPALSAAHDTTLNKAWDETGGAGVKISHSLRHAAARAVLEKMAEAACAKETKKKVSAGMSNFTAPQVTGAAAGPM